MNVQLVAIFALVLIPVALILWRVDRKNAGERDSVETQKWQQREDTLRVVITQAIKEGVTKAFNESMPGK